MKKSDEVPPEKRDIGEIITTGLEIAVWAFKPVLVCVILLAVVWLFICRISWRPPYDYQNRCRVSCFQKGYIYSDAHREDFHNPWSPPVCKCSNPEVPVEPVETLPVIIKTEEEPCE